MASPDPSQIALAQSLLDSAGIQWEVRNESVSQAEIGLPFATELWVLRDEELEPAKALVTGHGHMQLLQPRRLMLVLAHDS